jgi:putative ABC transport system substrate-binding protein
MKSELTAALSVLARRHAQALYVMDNAFFDKQGAEILKSCADAKIAATYGYRGWAVKGALFSYSADFGEMFGRAAGYVDRILKGKNPGDLPIEQPTRFDLVVNLRTARRLGLKLPDSFLVQATEVIR